MAHFFAQTTVIDGPVFGVPNQDIWGDEKFKSLANLDATENWRSLVLSQSEGWQCKNGTVFVTTDTGTPASLNQGIELNVEGAWPFPSGVTVYYRSAMLALSLLR